MTNVRDINSAEYIGKDFGPVTIVAEIGRGAMGIVFIGYQKTLKRQVAVKILPKATRQDRRTWELFRDEAETVAVLSHPNIVQIFEMGENESCYFLIMQLIEGDTLRTVIKSRLNHPLPSKRILPLPETIGIATAILDALAYAHEEGVVHQDVKPSNVIIDRRHHRPFLMDFGIARAMAAEYKSEGKIVGSPLYMSPEQARGYDTDRRSDIYSMGVILFEMVAGTLPVTLHSSEEILRCKQTDPVYFFSKSPRQTSPIVDERLDCIIGKATAARPEDRYQECGSFKHDLATLPGGSPPRGDGDA